MYYFHLLLIFTVRILGEKRMPVHQELSKTLFYLVLETIGNYWRSQFPKRLCMKRKIVRSVPIVLRNITADGQEVFRFYLKIFRMEKIC